MTAQEIIDEAKLDFPDETDTRALSDLQTIWDDLCWRYALIEASADISLTAGTREYSLPTDFLTAYSATYYTSATQSRRLTGTHRDAKDELQREWRDDASGTPREYYVRVAGGVIGFYPTPNTTTATYPKVTLYYTKRQDLLVGTTLSGNLPSYQACVEGLRYRMAVRTSDARAAVYRNEYMAQIRRLDTWLNGTTEFKPSVKPSLPTAKLRRRV